MEEGHANAATAEGLADDQALEAGTGRGGQLAGIGNMYETGQHTVNQSQVEIAPEIIDDSSEAPQCAAVGHRRRSTASGQQPHDVDEIRPTATANVKRGIGHAVRARPYPSNSYDVSRNRCSACRHRPPGGLTPAAGVP